MRFIIIGIAGLAALSAPVLAHGPARQQTSQSALPALARSAASTVDAFHAALAHGDTHAAADLLADDAVIYEEGGAERTKAEYAAHHLPADAQFSKAIESQVTRRTGFSEGGLAWVATEGRMKGTFNGKALDRLTTETVVLRQGKTGWKIVHIHWSSAAAK